MFSEKELKTLQRRKQVIVARGDLLRLECGQMWRAIGRRTATLDGRVEKVREIPPAAFAAAATGLSYLKRQYGPRKKVVQAALSVAGFALEFLRPPEGRARTLPPRDDCD
jgi:hypothetical protein